MEQTWHGRMVAARRDLAYYIKLARSMKAKIQLTPSRSFYLFYFPSGFQARQHRPEKP